MMAARLYLNLHKFIFLLIKDKLNDSHFAFVFSSTGQRPMIYCHCVVSIVHPSVRSCMRASVNSSFKKLLLRNY